MQGEPAPATVLLGAVTSDGVSRDLLLVAAPRDVFVWDLAQVLQATATVRDA